MQNYRVFLINKITLWFNVEHPFKEKNIIWANCQHKQKKKRVGKYCEINK